LIEPGNSEISIVHQCDLLDVNRSNFYYQPKPKSQENLGIMNRIDKIYTKHPYYGEPRITAQLERDGFNVNHKRTERLMKIMGIQGIVPKKNTSKKHPKHAVFPYLLKGIDINHPNHVWGTDITYIRAAGTWFYLTAILDWHSRFVISWKLSESMSSDFCITALKNALKIGIPEFHNSDQGSQFTAEEYIRILKQHQPIRISMDGRGRCFDNIFTERIWRTVKYEEVYLHDYRSFMEANQSLGKYFRIYNYERLHSALGQRPPAEVYFG